MNKKPEKIAANYCISFVDLLGQSAEYKGQGLLPIFKSEADREAFNMKIRNTIRPIYKLQEDASRYLMASLGRDSQIRKDLPPPLHDAFDKMREVKLVQQRWSDGLVYFVSLLEGTVKCPISGIYHLLGTVGSLCFLGLCRKSPLRGSIDISWAVELHPGEIYGAAVANAYELESKVAQYPRIIISERLFEYLRLNSLNEGTDVYSQFSKQLSEICLGMISIDFDGNYILDYLGRIYKERITKNTHKDLFDLALKFVIEQLELWHKNKNTILSMRYNHLFSYFQSREEDK